MNRKTLARVRPDRERVRVKRGRHWVQELRTVRRYRLKLVVGQPPVYAASRRAAS